METIKETIDDRTLNNLIWFVGIIALVVGYIIGKNFEERFDRNFLDFTTLLTFMIVGRSFIAETFLKESDEQTTEVK